MSSPPQELDNRRTSFRSRLMAMGADRRSAALLALAALAALIWVNSPARAAYGTFWSTPVALDIGSASLDLTLHSLVNDGLMAFFFFLVGLEVKREITIGELSQKARAVVPVAAAIGGLIMPALIFLAIAGRTGQAHAWGVVISTDTAFLIGALALVGPRHPARLRLFLLTMAVVDDIGALIVIGLFYSSNLRLIPLVLTAVGLVLVALTRFLPVGRGAVYGILAVLVWYGLHEGGLHPTLAGVAIALLIPVFAPRRREVEAAYAQTRAFRQSPTPGHAAAAARRLRESISINERLQLSFGPVVSYLVLPAFALANAGIRLDASALAAAWRSPLAWGVVAGLVVGKLVGITGATWLAVRSRLGRLPPGLRFDQVAGGATLSGIGFTISLLIVGIAIPEGLAATEARLGVLVGTVLAVILGGLVFAITNRRAPRQPVGTRLLRPFDPSRDHFRGSATAPLVVVEYVDFECPFCSRVTGSVDEVFEQLGSDVVWVWRHLPLTHVHPHATVSAKAFEAAALQERFLDFGPALFRQQDRLEREHLLALAEDLGLDLDRFAADLDGAEVARRVQEDADDAELMDLLSTPTFFVNGRRHTGAFDAANLVAALRASPDNAEASESK
ncbi:MAG: Na+/H+ antiporter NhaA [Micrococcales bacterium]|nr:Na+/H+ antiporter NhaA [Micrococcales bacterium]